MNAIFSSMTLVNVTLALTVSPWFLAPAAVALIMQFVVIGFDVIDLILTRDVLSDD